MPEPSETSQEDPWLEFFRRIRRLAAHLDALEADAKAEPKEDRE